MKSVILSLALSVLSLIGFTQAVKTTFGKTYNVGDTILLGDICGLGSYYKNTYNVKTYGQSSLHLESLTPYVITETIIDRKELENIIFNNPMMFDRNSNINMFAISRSRGGDNVAYIDIDGAARNRELVLKYNTNLNLRNVNYIDDEAAFLCLCKYSKIPIDKFVKEYFVRFKSEEYNNVKQDEFELKSFVNKTVETLKEKVGKVDTAIVYSMITSANLGEYDFNTKSFSFNLNNSSYSLLSNRRIFGLKTSELILVVNSSKIGSKFNISPEDANTFLKIRKSSDGSIDRKAYLMVHFKLRIASKNAFADYPAKSSYNFIADVKRIDFYDSRDFKYNWLGTIFVKH